MQSAIDLWREKLDYLRQQEAINSGVVEGFEIQQRIKEAVAAIDELALAKKEREGNDRSLTLLLFRAACARAAHPDRLATYKRYVDEAADFLAERANRSLAGTRWNAGVETFKKNELPWQFALAVLSLARLPAFLNRSGHPALAESLGDALAAFLKSPSSTELAALPDCDTLLLDPELAKQALGEFYAKLIDPGLTHSVEDAGLVLNGAELVVEEVRGDLDAFQVTLLSSVARMWRAIQAQASNAPPRDGPLPPVDSFLDQFDHLAARGAPRESQSFYFKLEGQTIILHSGKALTSIPPAWVNAAEHIAGSFSAAARPETPPLRSMYLEPLAYDFTEAPAARDRPSPEKSLPLQTHVASWLSYSPAVPFVIVGDPGVGKTSSCRWLVSNFLERWQLSGQSPEEYFPVYLALRDLRSDIPSLQGAPLEARGRDLLAIIIARMTRLSDVSNRAGPQGQRILLFLDGFDELSMVSRAEVSAFLDAVTLLSREEQLFVILTGRTIGFEPFWHLLDQHLFPQNRWRRVRLIPFTRGPGGTCERYARRCLMANSSLGNRLASPGDLLAVARDGAGFGNMVETPVLLSLLCDISLHQGSLLAPIQNLGWYGSVKWLVEECIRWRANPSEREREALTDGEYQRRALQYGRWAWQAVLSGGTSFQVDALEGFQQSGRDATLVEFFFTPSEAQAGQATFMHRSIAEFLAADYVVRRLLASDKSLAIDVLLDMARTMAQERLSLDANFKNLVSLRVRDATDLGRDLVARSAADLIDRLYFNPGGLNWNSASVASPRIMGAAAELALLFLLAARRDADPRRILQAIEVRNYSDRRLADWTFADAPRMVSGGDVKEMGLVGFNFSGATVRRVSGNGAVLINSSFREATLELCDFKQADLSRCDFRGATVSECQFGGATLAGAVLAGARFARCSLSANQLQAAGHVSGLMLEHHTALLLALQTARFADLPQILWYKNENPGVTYRWTGTFLGLRVLAPAPSAAHPGKVFEALIDGDRVEDGAAVEVWDDGSLFLRGRIRQPAPGRVQIDTPARTPPREPDRSEDVAIPALEREARKAREEKERRYANEVCEAVEAALQRWSSGDHTTATSGGRAGM